MPLVFLLYLVLAFLALPMAADAGVDPLSYRLRMPPYRGERALDWKKDPFVPAVQETGGKGEGLRLTAVFYNAKNPSAIVNDRIVYRGSLVRGQKVIDIGVTHVILHGDRGRLRLELSEIPELQDANKKD
ncbi:hypothetical protein BAC1_01888 [uncultured bacterium]|nr:hypothetical protein BAC1_01888 [uncultured bacterium]